MASSFSRPGGARGRQAGFVEALGRASCVLVAGGILLALLNWAMVLRDDMHARAILIVLLAMGVTVGLTAALILSLTRRILEARGMAVPGAGSLAAACGIAGVGSSAGYLHSALLLAELPCARALQAVLILAFAAVSLVVISWLARRLDRLVAATGPLGSIPGRFPELFLLVPVLLLAAGAFILSGAGGTRRAGLAEGGRAAGGRAGGGRAAGGRATGPNIILVSFDTLRPDHLSVYGYERATSPHIDDVMREGALFTQAIASSSWTVLSHATLMTGASPSRIGSSLLESASSGRLYLPEEARTLAETLRDRGYHTAGFIGGATMRSTFGFDQGFEVYDDMLPPSMQATAEHLWLAPKVRELARIKRDLFLAFLDPLLVWISNALYDQGFEPPPAGFLRYSKYSRRSSNSAEEVNAKVARYLDRIGARPDAPCFLFVHYFDAHSPYDAPAPWSGRWGNDGAGLGYVLSSGLVTDVMRDGRVLTAHETEVLVGSYDEEIAHLDDQFGVLMRMLAQRGLLDDAIVILFSDHGESFGEHGDLFHGHSLDEEQIRIVLSVRYPAKIARGIRIEEQVRAVDIMPTILDLADVQGEAAPREGISLTPLLREGGGAPRAPSFAFGELYARGMHDPDFGPFALDHFSVRGGGWKFMRDSDGSRRLYHVADDPGERLDLAGSEPARALEMEQRLTGWLAAGFSRSGGHEIDPRRIEELKGLGYAHGD